MSSSRRPVNSLNNIEYLILLCVIIILDTAFQVYRLNVESARLARIATDQVAAETGLSFFLVLINKVRQFQIKLWAK